MARSSRQCKGELTIEGHGVLEVDFSYDGQDIGEYDFAMALAGKVISHQDLIALVGPEAARSAVGEAVERGIDAPY